MNTNYANLVQAGLLLIAGYFFAHAVKKAIQKLLIHFTTIKHKQLIQRIVFYGIFTLFLLSALKQLGFNLEVLLGAAGIFSVAIGFASPTSASNFISGLFLIAERVISEGDTILVDGVTGEVISVDLLSTKLKTADNTFIRIPNETLIKFKMTNFSGFEERRLDLPIMFSYEQKIAPIESLWSSLIENHPLCLKHPIPEFKVESIEQNKILLLLSVWVKAKDHATLKSELQEKLLLLFTENHLQPYVEFIKVALKNPQNTDKKS
jgi:small-conductance mechanosensitive channel